MEYHEWRKTGYSISYRAFVETQVCGNYDTEGNGIACAEI